MFAGVTGWSLAVGIVTAMDVRKEEDEDDIVLGVQLQRTLLALGFLLVPVFTIWWNASILLTLIGQDHEIVTLAGKSLSVSDTS